MDKQDGRIVGYMNRHVVHDQMLKVRVPNVGQVLIRDTSSFSPSVQAAVSCSSTVLGTNTKGRLRQLLA